MQSMDKVPLLSYTKSITQHKSLDLVKSHCVTQCHAQGRSTCNFLALGKIYGMLIFQIRARFFRSPQLPRVFPLFFLARPLFSLAPNYRESPPFFSSLARFFRSPQLPRQSPLIFSSFTPNYQESPPLFFFLARPQPYRAWNRLSENLQSSWLFSTQCLRIEKSILLAFD